MKTSRSHILILTVAISGMILPGILALASQLIPHMKDLLSQWLYISAAVPLAFFFCEIFAVTIIKHKRNMTPDMEKVFRLNEGIQVVETI